MRWEKPTRDVIADVHFQDLLYDRDVCVIALNPEFLQVKKISTGCSRGTVANSGARAENEQIGAINIL